MNGVKDTADSIRKKLTIDDYELNKSSAVIPDVLPEKKKEEPENKIVKTTIYFSEEASQMLTKLVYQKKLANEKGDKSSVVCDAIQLLFARDYKE